MGCDNILPIMYQIKHEPPVDATVFTITGNDFCPYNNRSWTINQFQLGVTQNGLIVGKVQYKNQHCPILGRWDSNKIIYRMPYNNSNVTNMYQYIGRVSISEKIMQGRWYCEENPESQGHKGTFSYRLQLLRLETSLVPLGHFNIIGYEISQNGKVWATQMIELEGSNFNQFKGVIYYSNAVDGNIRSQFIGAHYFGALYTFELRYGNDIYAYKGMRCGNDIMGRWISISEPNNLKKQGSFLWKLS